MIPGDIMNPIFVTLTPKGTIRYPLHQHSYWEVSCYLSGRGHLATANGDIPFEEGSIIIVPPRTVHGSVSENGFVNIAIGGDFSHLFLFQEPVALRDNAAREGQTLAKLILRNRYANREYLSTLCTAYVHFLLQNAQCGSRISRVVAELITGITEHFSDPHFTPAPLLRSSGYAEDYIRTQFKNATTLTPVQFLTRTRITHAQKLLEIYGGSITVAEAALACGFEDPVYFSKRFKQLTGVSPDQYKKQVP